MFPPVSSYHRFLMHKTVEDFPLLCSFSIGEGDDRRSIVCLQELVLRYASSEVFWLIRLLVEQLCWNLYMSLCHWLAVRIVHSHTKAALTCEIKLK